MAAKAGCDCIIEHGKLISRSAVGVTVCCLLSGVTNRAFGDNTTSPDLNPELQVGYLRLTFHLQSSRQIPGMGVGCRDGAEHRRL